jgi:hypothetical protein
LNYLKINANDQLDLKGACLSGCKNTNLKHTFNIFMLDGIKNETIKLENQSYYFTTDSSKLNLAIRKELFQDFSTFKYWKIELVSFSFDKNLTTSSSLLFYVNQPPVPGMCNINPKNGTTSTLFTIYCTDWKDDDGGLVNYAFYGNFLKSFFNQKS